MIYPNSANLSPREVEILILVCNEASNNEILEKLFISKRTVEGHKNKIFRKTKSKSSIGLIQFAIRNKLIFIIHQFDD